MGVGVKAGVENDAMLTTCVVLFCCILGRLLFLICIEFVYNICNKDGVSLLRCTSADS